MTTESPDVKVLIVDFSPVVREGLRCILEDSENISLVGQAPDHPSALKMVAELSPDVVLTELLTEAINGIELIRELRERYPKMVLIVLTTSDKNNHIAEAVGAGANGYMLMHKLTERTLPQAIHLARSSTSALDSGVIQDVLYRLKENARASLITAGALSADLTDRELEVLRLLTSGKTDREIADQLVISLNTVNRHVRNVVGKLGSGNRTRAALLAAEAGIVEIHVDGREEPLPGS